MSDELIEAARKVATSYLFAECQPDRGDVFSFMDDRLDPLLRAVAPIFAEAFARVAEDGLSLHPRSFVKDWNDGYETACNYIAQAIRDHSQS